LEPGSVFFGHTLAAFGLQRGCREPPQSKRSSRVPALGMRPKLAQARIMHCRSSPGME
jgi:hypothetical protein